MKLVMILVAMAASVLSQNASAAGGPVGGGPLGSVVVDLTRPMMLADHHQRSVCSTSEAEGGTYYTCMAGLLAQNAGYEVVVHLNEDGAYATLNYRGNEVPYAAFFRDIQPGNGDEDYRLGSRVFEWRYKIIHNRPVIYGMIYFQETFDSNTQQWRSRYFVVRLNGATSKVVAEEPTLLAARLHSNQYAPNSF